MQQLQIKVVLLILPCHHTMSQMNGWKGLVLYPSTTPLIPLSSWANYINLVHGRSYRHWFVRSICDMNSIQIEDF